ncbi:MULTISPECIES: hypothetical protein [unclassified Chryseobacterium]|uniref:hypothetical protein n=1 Tax=unclassified Chryseobacterium TaxID=2593645 RepID=UPI000D3C2C9E|nr:MULTISPECIES: hypothetical protein [unclassified Chryseobacterium]PTT69875.1 hypothetical protein DBR25_18805 [Chryseobacterium sp. HMWF001]
MKKKSIDFESRFWCGRKKHSALSLMEVFFQFQDWATAKKHLNLIMQYAAHRKTRIPEDASVIFYFHQSLRSFIRAAYSLRNDRGKWLVHELSEHKNPILKGSLSEKEYRDPAKVFRKAFKKYRLEEFEEFLSEVVYFSLGTFNNAPECNIVDPYLLLIKMLDAAWLILERESNREKLSHEQQQTAELQST